MTQLRDESAKGNEGRPEEAKEEKIVVTQEETKEDKKDTNTEFVVRIDTIHKIEHPLDTMRGERV